MRAVVLKGGLVSLAVPVREDVKKAWVWWNDREVRRFLTSPHEIFFYEDEIEWYEALRREKRKEKVFSIIENASGSVIGFIGLRKIDHYNGHAEVGYFIAREHWGYGYATEAVKLVLEYAFEWLNLRKVYAYVYAPNEPSIKVLEKNGFSVAGRLKEHHYLPGEGFVDELILERFKV